MKAGKLLSTMVFVTIILIIALAINRHESEIDDLKEEIRVLQTKDAEVDLNLDVVREQLKYSPTNILKQVDEELSEKIQQIDDMLTGGVEDSAPIPVPVAPTAPVPSTETTVP